MVLRRFRRTRRAGRAKVGRACCRTRRRAFGQYRKRAARSAARYPFEPAREWRRRDSVPEPQNARSSRSGLIATAKSPMPADEATHIDSTLSETRKFPPPAEFSARAWVKSREEYEALYKRADADPETFWAECARNLHWFKPFGKTLEWNFPFAKWFIGGTINASYNCLDRHLEGPRRNKAALIWEGEPRDSRVLTYQMLAAEVAQVATARKRRDV